MTQYLLFEVNAYYCSGGLNEFVLSFDDPATVSQHYKKKGLPNLVDMSNTTFQVMNTNTNEWGSFKLDEVLEILQKEVEKEVDEYWKRYKETMNLRDDAVLKLMENKVRKLMEVETTTQQKKVS